MNNKVQDMIQDIIVDECTEAVDTDYLSDALDELILTIKENLGGSDYMARKVLINYIEAKHLA